MSAPRAMKQAEEHAEELRKAMYEEPTPEPGPAEDDDPVPGPEIIEGHPEYKRLQEAHKALQGKYDAEVPRLAAELRELKHSLQEAKQSKAEAEKQAQQAQQKLAALEKLREDFGDSADAFAAVSSETAREVSTEATQKLRDEQSQEAVNRFWRAVNRSVPDFQAVNANPAFDQWLHATTNDQGVSLKQELNEAGQDLDSYTVIRIFDRFKAAQSPGASNAKGPADHVAPPRKSSERTAEQKPRYTAQDFVRLQDEIRRGMWRGREAEALALEKEIHAAIYGAQ